jgi:hypothetical protein
MVNRKRINIDNRNTVSLRSPVPKVGLNTSDMRRATCVCSSTGSELHKELHDTGTAASFRIWLSAGL